MCSSCGGKKSARLPGSTSANPIILGEPNESRAQLATFNVKHQYARIGDYKHVGGSGVDEAVANGDITMGYQPQQRSNPAPRRVSEAPEWYVQIGANRWVGFKKQASAQKYADSSGGVVVARSEILKRKAEA